MQKINETNFYRTDFTLVNFAVSKVFDRYRRVGSCQKIRKSSSWENDRLLKRISNVKNLKMFLNYGYG